MPDGRQNSHFVERILLLLIGKIPQLHPLQSILAFVEQPLDLVYTGVSSLPQLLQDLELLQ